MGKALDLKGRRFGKLVVIDVDPDYIPQRGRHKKWLCKCDCGQTKVVQSNHLIDGTTQACCPACRHKIEEGTKFGNLIVIEMTDKRSKNGGSVLYKCQCSCGEIIDVPSVELRAGRKFSCNKCNESSGVIQITNLLEENNIEYVKEFIFLDLKSNKGKYLRFDFYLPEKNMCIEYDGAQHFKPVKYWGGEKTFLEIQERDALKNEYCKNNGIKLVRIPYTLKNITLEDLCL